MYLTKNVEYFKNVTLGVINKHIRSNGPAGCEEYNINSNMSFEYSVGTHVLMYGLNCILIVQSMV